MDLSKEVRVELVLLRRHEGWSCKRTADKVNALHLRRIPIVFSTVVKVISKFKEIDSIMDKPRSVRTSVSIKTNDIAMAKVHESPKKSICRISNELGFSKSTIVKIVKQKTFHPYRLQILHHLIEVDPDRQIKMCEWFLTKLNDNIRITKDCVLFSDEAIFNANGEVNRKKCMILETKKSTFVDHSKHQGVKKVMVWCIL